MPLVAANLVCKERFQDLIDGIGNLLQVFPFEFLHLLLEVVKRGTLDDLDLVVKTHVQLLLQRVSELSLNLAGDLWVVLASHSGVVRLSLGDD